MESLESIHAARLRSGSEAGTSAPQLQQPAEASRADVAHSDSDEDDPDKLNDGMGEQDSELDPYMLPVSHEVALEGTITSLHKICTVYQENCSYNKLPHAEVPLQSKCSDQFPTLLSSQGECSHVQCPYLENSL